MGFVQRIWFVQRIRLFIHQSCSFDNFKKIVELTFKITVMIAILVMLFNAYSYNTVVSSLPQENTDTRGTQNGDQNTLHSSDTDEVKATRQTSQIVIGTTTTRYVQMLEEPRLGPVDISSFLVAQTPLNETHCICHFIVENIAVVSIFADYKIVKIVNIPLEMFKVYSKCCKHQRVIRYKKINIAEILLNLLNSSFTRFSLTKTIQQQDCKSDDTSLRKLYISNLQLIGTDHDLTY